MGEYEGDLNDIMVMLGHIRDELKVSNFYQEHHYQRLKLMQKMEKVHNETIRNIMQGKDALS